MNYSIIFFTTLFCSSSVQSLNCVRFLATPWTAARKPSCPSPKVMSIESVMPSNHLIRCHSLLLPPIFPSIRVFSNESALCIRWPKYWSFSFNISPSNEHSGLISLVLSSKYIISLFVWPQCVFVYYFNRIKSHTHTHKTHTNFSKMYMYRKTE